MGLAKNWAPLSFGQEALWFLWKLVPETWAYNIVLPAGVRGPLDATAFRAALQAISDRHPALRLAFREEGGTPFQHAMEQHEVLLDEIDASGWDDAQVEAAIHERARTPFDLGQSAAMRTTLFRRSADHHVLLIVVSHIVSDLWSLIVVMDELRELYAAANEGRACTLPPLPMTFDDVVRQQRVAIEGEAGDRLWQYWRDELSGELPVLDLPADRSRPAMQSFRGGTIVRRMPAELTRKLKQVAGRERVTLYMLLLAAYEVLLHRYTGQESFVVGSPTSGRERPELQGIAGDFVNMVPLRADLAGAPAFRELLARVRARVLGTIQHQDYPFSLLVDRLHPVRDLSRSPIFQTTFVLQKFHRFPELSRVMLPDGNEPPIPFADLQLEPIALAQQDGQFDLNVEMKEDERGQLAGAWKFAADLFDAATIERMAAHFETLLESIAADPSRNITELPLLGADESREAIERGQAIQRELPDATICELFEAQAARRGDAIAISCGGESVTYAELHRRVISLARNLVHRGVGRDTVVAVLLPRGIDFITALLAISKAGGAFLPLDARHAASRTSQIIEDSGAKLVLTTVAHEIAGDALPRVGGNDLAYVMYTSGSTGRPKGVMVEHRGMVNHCFAKLSDLELGEDGVLAQNGPPTFDIVVWQCLAPLAAGGRVVVFPDDVAEDPSKLLGEVEARGVTALQLVPSMLRAVLDEDPRPLTTLRWIVPTGEALPTTLCRRWLERYPHIPLLNTYGSTECSDDQCHYVIRSLTSADDAVAIASIGTPIHNMTAHVLDANLAPVPAGVAGDLYIGGIGVGRGYINDPDRTAAAFISDPFSTRPNARLYRTRDLARRRADGNLDFLGRVDAMIKLRGFRIEPGEIEAALAQHPSVAAAAVLAREHPSRERVLVAYVVARAACSVDELRQFLGERLPQYMVPTAITFLDALPLTANGKLDPRQLPAPQWELSEEQELVAPRTPAEEALAAIWAEVLGLERVGVTHDFFAIGGDSIKSIQIVARCKRAGFEIRPSDLFQHPTIAALAAVAKRAIADDAIFLPEQDTYPLSPMQEGMLFHTISAPSTDVYVQQLSCRLAGELRVADFERAWQTIMQRHPVLRTAFAWRGLPQPQQVVSDDVRLPFEVLPAQDIDALCASERRAGFDLRQAPLMRLKLVRLSDHEHQLIWTWHHIILDAWSVPIIMEELFALYGGQAEPPRSRPYHDFVAWQRSRDLAPAETFWRGLLADFKEPTALAIEQPANAATDGYGLEFLPLPDSEADALRAAARRSRLTLNTLVQGAWALLLSRYSGREDVVFGTAVAGRPPEVAGVERMVGLLINTIPTRVRVAPDRRVGEWLDELQRAQAEARRFEHAPLVQVQGWSGVTRGTQLFDSLLVFENVPLDVDRLRGSGLDLVDFDFVERANFPLTVMMEVRTRSKLGVGYDRNRFDRASMLRMLSHLRTLLAQICEDPERRLRDLDPMVDGYDWSREPYAAPAREATITELFEAQVSRTPDAIAAVFAAPEGDVSLTYRRLNEEADRIAQSLRSQGVVAGDRVAICMEASLERLASILGVLKAGAAYVPLEPTLPAARREEMIADSGARVVLGERSESRESFQSGTPGLAYIIYTSGSTGRPKGVSVTHRSLRHLVDAQIDAFQITNESRVLQFASLSFDASVSEIFTALLAGARLYMAPRNLLVPSREMLRLMERWEISVVTLPPSVLARLPESGLPALRTLVSAGEACPTDLAERWSKRRRFLNAYGPTEITVCASIAEYRGSGKPSIGRPMGGARIYIVDEQLRPVPIGVAGEMLVGGPGVARGYWNRPELTAASFIEDPFEKGGRVYRTGDVARFLPNREIEFLGRRDDQVKVHGFRIEPGEIESALRADPSVREAAVAIEGDRIIAYVVPNTSPKPEWWPSIAEYFVYDDLAYHAMTSDERRNESYRAAIRDTVRGKVVVEVGTGPEAILSRFCAEAGARKVYAIEMLPETFEKARKRVRELGLDDRIEVILGDATKVALPEPADVCVSEIVGAIGGSEGAAIIMNGVRHLLRDGAAMIPRRSTTLFAPVQLPDSLFAAMAFSDLPARYVERIFAEVGHAFDLRLCVKGIGPSALLAEPRVFEDLDYSRHTEPEVRHHAEHLIARDGRLDGFLVWLTLDTGGGERIDILEHEHCWLPVFFPIGDRVDVRAGDRIESLCGAIVSGDAPHPDYFLEGTLTRGGETMHFRHDAPRHGNAFRSTPFYQRFFANDIVPRAADTKERLRQRLPEYMLPDVFIHLDELPLLPSGKLDRRALPSAAAPKPKLEIVPPRSETERAVARIWQDILEIPDAGLQTNFFDHGGHSLLLLRVQDRIKEEIGVDVSVTDLFNHPTVESLAGRLTQQTNRSNDDRTRQRVAARQQALGRIASRRAAALKEESQ